MLQVQEKYLEYLEELDNELSKNNKSNQSEYLKQKIKKFDLVIPVVGAFSAGKSSLINSFLVTCKVDTRNSLGN